MYHMLQMLTRHHRRMKQDLDRETESLSIMAPDATLGREIYLEDYVNPLNGDDITVSFVRNGETKTIKYSPEIEKRYIVGMQYAPSDTEAEITQVTRGSAFFKAGVQAGDVVTEIDGTAIKTGNET